MGCGTSLFLKRSAPASTPDLLSPVFRFLELFSRFLDLGLEAGTDLAIPWLKHLEVLQILVNETEAAGSRPTKLSPETERDDGGGVGHVELFSDVCLRRERSVRI